MNNWTRHAEGWIDNTTGLLWHFGSKNKLNWEEAKAWAEEQRGRLPTREEFKTAEKNGVRKLDNVDRCYWYWSSTPYGYYHAYLFYGNNGSADDVVNRDYRYSSVFARCVSAAPGVKKHKTKAAINVNSKKSIQKLLREALRQLGKL